MKFTEFLAAIRETAEETSLLVREVNFVTSTRGVAVFSALPHQYQGTVSLPEIFDEKLQKSIREHDEFAWVDAHELEDIDLIPGYDLENIIKKILASLKKEIVGTQ